MRSKRAAHEIPDAPDDTVTPQAKERIRDGLEERGLPSEASERMSSRLEEHADTAPAELDAMLDGVFDFVQPDVIRMARAVQAAADVPPATEIAVAATALCDTHPATAADAPNQTAQR